MKIWDRVRYVWRGWRLSTGHETRTQEAEQANTPLWKMQESLRGLLDNPRVPPEVRSALEADYRQVASMLDKLEHGHIHIAAFGRVSVGKSSLLNALLGTRRFHVSALHGATLATDMDVWREADDGGVFFIDTPGIDEVGGEGRELIAQEAAERCDLILFVVDSDLTATELDALRALAAEQRPLLLVLNKSDRYTAPERAQLLEQLVLRSHGLLPPTQIVACAASPAPKLVITRDKKGNESEFLREMPADVSTLRDRLWQILEREGKTLAALNAGLFAGRLSDQVSKRITEVRHDVASHVIHSYCLIKGVAVALNPIPVADLVAAIALDVSLVVHLSRVYGLPATRRQASGLIRVIATQMGLLMGTVWGVNVVASTLKGLSAGMSTAITGTTQGAVAYYATHVVGRSAEDYYARGGSWGKGGPRRAVQDILANVDKESLLRQARDDIRSRVSRAIG